MLANAGVPMIALHLPAMAALLVPIIAIEFILSLKQVPLPNRRRLHGVAAANLVSTFVGLPITWMLMLILNVVTTGTEAKGLETAPQLLASVVLQSSWLVPYESDLGWLIPAATLVLLVPYFFVSVAVERLVLRKVWKSESSRTVAAFAWLANGVTYGILAVGTAGLLWQAISNA